MWNFIIYIREDTNLDESLNVCHMALVVSQIIVLLLNLVHHVVMSKIRLMVEKTCRNMEAVPAKIKKKKWEKGENVSVSPKSS
jgi:hypothetical protein